MRLYAFHCGGDRCDLAIFDPLDAAVGTKVYDPFFFYLVQHDGGNVLFDTGIHPALGTDPASRLGAAAETFVVELAPDDDVVSRLASVGVGPGDVEHVVQSHLHFDHAGGLEFFPDSTVYVQRRELEFAHDPPVYQRGYYVPADFDHRVAWNELDGELDLFGDGRVVAYPTPGHTPGHQSLLVRLDGQAVLLLSDATYSVQKMRERLLPAILWSPDAMIRSWERIEQLERQYEAMLIPTHELAFRERLRLAPDVWYE
jgi:N-acyl homoserine lactone hydrolase